MSAQAVSRSDLAAVSTKSTGKMVTTVSNVEAEAARLALEMESAATPFLSDLGEELPAVKPVLETLEAICQTVAQAETDREELVAIEKRCTYVTAYFIVKCRQNPGVVVMITPLHNCMEAIGAFFESCSRRGGEFSAELEDKSDKDEIAGLNERLNHLKSDLSLAGIATFEGKTDEMKVMLVNVAASKLC